ncbi:cerebellin-2-like [Brachyhypopomus gauderio]|uniref:cerebellin-2-like n=1 Tax=Brachyhypopomus gauderio TaxID=698409 RepID=UPI004042B1DD
MKSVALLVLLCCSPYKMEVQGDDHESIGKQTILQVKTETSKNKRHAEEQSPEATVGKTSIQQTYQSSIITFLLTQMSSMEERLRTSEKHVEELQKENKDIKVAFSASLLGSGGNQNIGPLDTRITLIYRHVFTNIGKPYNPHTGIFTAPVRGVYKFEIFVYAGSSDKYPSTVSLMKNGVQVLVVHGHQVGLHLVNASNGASLLLEAGDVVYVQLWENRVIMDNKNCHSTFSGQLLFTLNDN